MILSAPSRPNGRPSYESLVYPLISSISVEPPSTSQSTLSSLSSLLPALQPVWDDEETEC